MAVGNRTSLSAGIIISEILKTDKGVSAITKKIFPVVTDEAKLPYVIYRRSGFEQAVNKGHRPNDTIYMEILCVAATYKDSIDLAEAVRSSLDGAQYQKGNLSMRSCILEDGEEGYQDDAFVQNLVFSIKI